MRFRRLLLIFLAAAVLLCGCSLPGASSLRQYSTTYLDLFDTVVTVTGYAESESEYLADASAVQALFEHYHQLFDIYDTYPGLNNLKTVNDNAGIAPVVVDPEIIALLKDCKSYYELTGGRVNAAMGSVLTLWADARAAGIADPDNAALPDMDALREASLHTDLSKVVIDEEASTVYLEDPMMSLDVGAVAKGWTAQRVAEQSPGGMLLSVGGNIVATGPKPTNDGTWKIGIKDPFDGTQNAAVVTFTQGSVVTSGDYQRYYTVDGRIYCHIIDPDTLMPGTYWKSVTIVCEDSGLADALSTALFLLPFEEGKALAESCGVNAYLIDTDGNIFTTDGFDALLLQS